jgi:very-short-patch-repair endonuclease
MVHAWLKGTNVAVRLTQRFVSTAARGEKISSSELRARLAGHAPAQINELMSRWACHVGCSAELAQTLLCGADGDLERWIVTDFPRTLCDLNRLTELAPLLITSDHGHGIEWTSSALRTAIELARRVPTLDVAVVVTPEAISSWERIGSPRERAIVSEGLVPIESPRTQSHSAAIARLPARDDGLQRAPVQGHRSVCPPDPQAAPIVLKARSAAEALLFEILQAEARTRDRFALNVRVATEFGSAPLEIDLLCEALKLAIEVDGYHHFTDSVAYRRDRRKDVLLQALGYMVVRVLATDVADEREYVLTVIERAIAECERRMQ